MRGLIDLREVRFVGKAGRVRLGDPELCRSKANDLDFSSVGLPLDGSLGERNKPLRVD